jgi:hypothetical protein
LMAVAASENVQLARVSRLDGAADTSAPAPRRREVSVKATMMNVVWKEDDRKEWKAVVENWMNE